MVLDSNNHKSKILFITSLLDKPGGAEKNICDVVMNLDRSRFIPNVLVFKGGELSHVLEANGIPVIHNGLGKLFSFEAIRKGKETARLLRREGFNIVVTYHHDADIWGSVVARLAGVPVIISSRRDMGYQLDKRHIRFYRWFHWLFTNIIVVSEAVKNKIVEREGIPVEKIRVIYNGIDDRSLAVVRNPEDIRNELGIVNGEIVVGMVASFRPIKGQMLMVEAIQRLIEDRQALRVIFVGDHENEYGRQVRSRIDELKLTNYFLFTGVRRDIPVLLQAFDIFALTSESEGFSNAIIEAMSAQLPIVAPSSGGNPEAIQHGQTGYLYPPGDSSALSECLKTLANNPGLRESMGRYGRANVEKNFNLGGMIRQNEDIYVECLRKKRRIACS